MNNDFIKKARRQPNGARFYRCALHVNPHQYSELYRGKPLPMTEDQYIEALIQNAIELNIQVLAITDHNHVGSIDKFRSVAKEKGIYVFPGFEITSAEGIHIICLYPPDFSIDHLNRFLGEFGIREIDPSSKISNKSFTEILKIVIEQGGISIAAHVTHANGLFKMLDGQSAIKAWRDENLLAVQIPGRIEDLPNKEKQIIRNKNSDYRREPARAPDLAIAVINAKDIVQPEDLADPSATCWIKMGEISIQGLRQAFLDPASRIRLNTDPESGEHSELVAMSWQGGFLDGTLIHFNENLNVFIGGRGTGKSTVVESIRYVFGLDPIGEDAHKAHMGIVKEVLRSGTKISLLVKSHTPATREYIIERTVPNNPIVRDINGAVLSLIPSDVIPQLEVYGQHEISEIAKSPDKLTSFIERFVKHPPEVIQHKRELKQRLKASRERIITIQDELLQIEERLAFLPRLEETIKRYQDAGFEDKLEKQSLFVKEESILNTSSRRILSFEKRLRELRKELPIDRTFISSKALEGLPSKDILFELDITLEQLSQRLLEKTNEMDMEITQALTAFQAIKLQWEERKNAARQEYEKTLRELQKSGINGEEFIQLRRQIEDLRPLQERHAVLQNNLQEEETHRRSFLIEWEEAKRKEFEEIANVVKSINRQLANRVQVSVNYAKNREPLIKFLREKIGGRLNQAIDKIRNIDQFSLQEFAKACQEGKEALVQRFGIISSQADTLAKARPEVIMEMQELELPPETIIKLNIAGEEQSPIWQKLEDLSTGQKATALLFLLLLKSDAPLVIDQPEDDLDNRFITEGIVPKMREEKRQRQFIFSTHNANIPVLGDAELILGLSVASEGGQLKGKIEPEHIGAIDFYSVRSLVEEVLEGGPEAFKLRKEKYGY